MFGAQAWVCRRQDADPRFSTVWGPLRSSSFLKAENLSNFFPLLNLGEAVVGKLAFCPTSVTRHPLYPTAAHLWRSTKLLSAGISVEAAFLLLWRGFSRTALLRTLKLYFSELSFSCMHSEDPRQRGGVLHLLNMTIIKVSISTVTKGSILYGVTCYNCVAVKSS